MEREEEDDMLFFFLSITFDLVGIGENISSFPVCVPDVNRRRVESVFLSCRQVKVN